MTLLRRLHNWIKGRLNALTIRQRLVLGITLLHGLLTGFLVIDLVSRQNDFLYRESREHTGHLSETLAVASASWVMANDVVGLQEVTLSIARHEDVRYVMLLAPDGRVLSHSNPRHIGRHVEDAVSLGLLGARHHSRTLIASDTLIDVATPVMAGSTLIAWARVAIGQEQNNAALRAVRVQGSMFIVIAVGLGYVFALLMAQWLTEGLNRLGQAFRQVRAGERNFRLPTARGDEIGQLGQGFNAMLAELETNEAELIELATTDFLTGLANRRHFIARMEEQLARVQRTLDQPVAVLMLDLDHFKLINDTHGHAAGDEMLRHFARLMQESLRRIDTAGRVGGEEFAILLPAANRAAALSFAERLREKVASTPLVQDGKEIPVTVSIGLTTMLPTDPNADITLSRADEALYRAKQTGRNRVEITGAQ